MDAILNILSYVGWVLLAIMILVFVHELGHFLFAKLFRMRVDKFSIGFPPRVLGKKIGETEYVLGLTPLGGYVKIAGMVDESMDTDFVDTDPEPHEFRAKPVWQRMVVITAGVIFNMILAAVVFIGLKATYGEAFTPPVGPVIVADSSVAWQMGLRTGDEIVSINDRAAETLDGLSGIEQLLLKDRLRMTVRRDSELVDLVGPSDLMTRLSRSQGAFGMRFDPSVVGTVAPGSPAAGAGLLPGDRIVAYGDSTVRNWSDLPPIVQALDGQAAALRYVRPDSLVSVVPPSGLALPDSLQPDEGTLYEVQLAAEKDGGRYLIGVGEYVLFRRHDFGSAVVAGLDDTWLQTRLIATSLKRVFTGQDDFRENLGGPVMIAKITKEAADQGAPFFWQIVAMLSITLAIINILPIPALDGGHLVFLIYEGIARREPSLKLRMVMQQIGMFLLLAFMVFVIFNDILKL
jgi:regulator of sigma E protease